MLQPAALLLLWGAIAAPTPLVPISGGAYRPLYAPEPGRELVEVGPFAIEEHPVTVAQFRAFVTANPGWRPGEVAGLQADEGYLKSWRATGLPVAGPDRPITEVSWFAARAYCAWLGRRLPTEDEWELVARASESLRDASEDDAWLAKILAWYGRPSTEALASVRSRPPNLWGVYDLHELVWEWVEDFNNTLVSSDARESGDDERLRFCGVGAVDARDVRDYANFMRVAWRSSVEGKTTTKNLGFRCAADGETR